MGLTGYILISLVINLLLVSRTQGEARFTVVPPSVSYVSVGETAKLVWDYTVDNRNEEFDVSSPVWSFYDENGSAFEIAYENAFNNWKWSININTCPARLLNPVRVSKESTATLVIHNVTLAGSGTYGCVLVLRTRSPITSKVKLIVTSLPHITLNPSASSKIPINESQGLLISCSAVGTPAPNVTWQTVKNDVMNQVVGKVILNIRNITRHDHGIYNCCANNNPNKPPVCKSTLVSVQYKPEIDVLQSNSILSSYNGSKIRLYCLARGVPFPMITWYDPSNQSITTGLHNMNVGSLLELITINPDSYGLYRCKAENILGYDEHFINVTQTALPPLNGSSKYINLISTTSRINTVSTLKLQSKTSPTSVIVSTNAPTGASASSPDPRDGSSNKKDNILLAVGCIVIFILVTTITILIVMVVKKSKINKGVKEQQDKNEVPSLSPEDEDKNMPIYAKVDLAKKKRNRQQEEIPIYAQVDKSKKKNPDQIIYAELDDLHSTEIFPTLVSPQLRDRDLYDDIDFTQNKRNAVPIYESVPME